MKSLTIFAIALLISFASLGQAPSPGSKLIQTVGFTEVTVEYSRPGVKDRTIFGDLLKYGEVWRVGANAATKITFNKTVKIGDSNLSGPYAILAIPGEKEWTVNFYSITSFATYTNDKPTVSTTVKPSKLTEPVETFTIDINNIRNTSATIDFIWEKTKVSIPFTVGTE
ncbi:MAG: DUF2911 domain-containing protein [Bacteroidota bacterium]